MSKKQNKRKPKNNNTKEKCYSNKQNQRKIYTVRKTYERIVFLSFADRLRKHRSWQKPLPRLSIEAERVGLSELRRSPTTQVACVRLEVRL